MRKIGVLAFVTLLLITTRCQSQSLKEKVDSLLNFTVDTVSVAVLKNTINKNNNVYLLDARSAKEYKVSHIKGAHYTDYESFDPKQLKDVPKSKEIIVYCSVGYRSEKIGEQLKKAGYKNVRNLYGGIFSWKNKGFKVVNNNGLETEKVHTYNKNWSKYLIKGVRVYE